MGLAIDIVDGDGLRNEMWHDSVNSSSGRRDNKLFENFY